MLSEKQFEEMSCNKNRMILKDYLGSENSGCMCQAKIRASVVDGEVHNIDLISRNPEIYIEIEHVDSNRIKKMLSKKGSKIVSVENNDLLKDENDRGVKFYEKVKCDSFGEGLDMAKEEEIYEVIKNKKDGLYDMIIETACYEKDCWEYIDYRQDFIVFPLDEMQ